MGNYRNFCRRWLFINPYHRAMTVPQGKVIAHMAGRARPDKGPAPLFRAGPFFITRSFPRLLKIALVLKLRWFYNTD